MLRSVSVLTFGTASFKPQGLSLNFFQSQSGALTVPAQSGQAFPGPRLSHDIFWHCRQKRVLKEEKGNKVTNEYTDQVVPVAEAYWLFTHNGEQETSESRAHADDTHVHFQVLPLKIHS